MGDDSIAQVAHMHGGTRSDWQSGFLYSQRPRTWYIDPINLQSKRCVSFIHSFTLIESIYGCRVFPRIHNACIVIISSALCNALSEPSGSSGWRGGRSEGFAAREGGGEEEWMAEGGKAEETWDIKGNLGWENENGMKHGGRRGNAHHCIHQQQEERQNVCFCGWRVRRWHRMDATS